MKPRLPRMATTLLAIALAAATAGTGRAQAVGPPDPAPPVGLTDEAWDALEPDLNAADATQPTPQRSAQPATHDGVPGEASSLPGREDVPLTRGSSTRRAAAAPGGAAPSNTASWLRTLFSLGGVVGLILLLAWGYRTITGLTGTGPLARMRSSGFVQLLSRMALSPRHSVCLIRVGPRLVLVGMSGDRLTPLDTFDNAELAASLAGQAAGRESEAQSAEFQRFLEREAQEFERLDAAGDEPSAGDDPRIRGIRQTLARTAQRLASVAGLSR